MKNSLRQLNGKKLYFGNEFKVAIEEFEKELSSFVTLYMAFKSCDFIDLMFVVETFENERLSFKKNKIELLLSFKKLFSFDKFS